MAAINPKYQRITAPTVARISELQSLLRDGHCAAGGRSRPKLLRSRRSYKEEHSCVRVTRPRIDRQDLGEVPTNSSGTTFRKFGSTDTRRYCSDRWQSDDAASVCVSILMRFSEVF